MKTIRPYKTDPIPLTTSPPRVGIVLIRFVVLLAIAAAVIALAWFR